MRNAVYGSTVRRSWSAVCVSYECQYCNVNWTDRKTIVERLVIFKTFSTSLVEGRELTTSLKLIRHTPECIRNRCIKSPEYVRHRHDEDAHSTRRVLLLTWTSPRHVRGSWTLFAFYNFHYRRSTATTTISELTETRTAENGWGYFCNIDHFRQVLKGNNI